MSQTRAEPVDRHLNEERRRIILEKLNREGRVLVSQLAEELSISPVTVRNDLNSLAREGLVLRAHGGAVKAESTLLDRQIGEKAQLHTAEKAAIAAKAATFVSSGHCVVLDSGSTTTAVARAIKPLKNLTVITNALNIAVELTDSPGVEIILTGGVLRRNSLSVVGHLAEDVLRGLTADIMFLGVDGIDPQFGYTTPNLLESRVNHQMIRISKETIVVADSSKFGRRSLAVICPVDQARRIITDSGVDPRYVRELEALGIEMIIV
ncbi:MAG TPA: transcriptional repressor AgaR [Acidobacteriota bacterium]|nr:transcriptional repressor AgaR [Acidobacteriota bacterium]